MKGAWFPLVVLGLCAGAAAAPTRPDVREKKPGEQLADLLRPKRPAPVTPAITAKKRPEVSLPDEDLSSSRPVGERQARQ